MIALRSPLFGCGDDDLWTWKRARGSCDLLATPTDRRTTGRGHDHPVAAALDYLRRLHRRRPLDDPERGAGHARRGPPDARGRRRRRRARATSGDDCGSWSTRRALGRRSSTADAARLPRLGCQAGRGVLAGRRGGAARDRRRRRAHHDHPRRQGPGVPDGRAVRHDLAAAQSQRRPAALDRRRLRGQAHQGRCRRTTSRMLQPIDEQMDAHERRRLLYVAATRARDHLVVSLHRGPGNVTTNAKLLAEAGAASRGRGVRAIADRRSDRGNLPRAGCLSSNASSRLGCVARAHELPFARRRRRCPRGAPPGSRGRSPRSRWPRTSWSWPDWPRAAATSTCRRGGRAAMAPRSAVRFMASSRSSTSRREPVSTTRSPLSASPRASPSTPSTSPRW